MSMRQMFLEQCKALKVSSSQNDNLSKQQTQGRKTLRQIHDLSSNDISPVQTSHKKNARERRGSHRAHNKDDEISDFGFESSRSSPRQHKNEDFMMNSNRNLLGISDFEMSSSIDRSTGPNSENIANQRKRAQPSQQTKGDIVGKAGTKPKPNIQIGAILARQPTKRLQNAVKNVTIRNELAHQMRNSQQSLEGEEISDNIVPQEDNEGKVKDEVSEQELEQDLNNSLLVQGRNRKLKSLISILMTVFVFAGYFVGSYFMAIQNYTVASASMADIYTILFKEACFTNMMAFIRENQARNQSVLRVEDGKVASTFMINKCLGVENDYLVLRKSLPDYLQAAAYAMNDIESPLFCQEMFKDTKTQVICEKALNGILSKGISNALSFFYREAQKTQRRFEDAAIMGTRNLEFLKEELQNEQIIEIMDVKMSLLWIPFEHLKDASMQSVLSYFNSVIGQIIALYSVFMVFLVICLILFFVFAFQRIKNIMWNTNILLGLIPNHSFKDREAEQQLKQFIDA